MISRDPSFRDRRQKARGKRRIVLRERGQPANFHAVDLIVPRLRSGRRKKEECPREPLSLECGFQVAHCRISSAFFMTIEMRRTRAAEMVTDRSIVGVNLCLVRRLFSRLFTPPRQCRRSRGARVRPTDPARGTQGTYIRQRSSRFVCLSSRRMSSRSFL